MKLTEIQDLIKFVARSGVTEVELEQKDFKILIRTANSSNKKGGEVAMVQQQMPVAQPMQVAAQPAVAVVATPPAKSAADEAESKYITIKSPMIGTFYRSHTPESAPFVNVGDEIAPGKVICIIEAMKLFNEIESEVKGKIVKVLANDASPVEYDQPLFLIDPS